MALAVRLAFAFALSHLVSVQIERTFERLRYSLGGDRPRQTAHLTMSTATTPGRRLESQHFTSAIPTPTPQILAYLLHSLRPILHINYPNSMQSCSKGSRGLFVPLRGLGIFTDTTTSPSSQPRQCSDRYTIRAGRNLPDKEFRYLRTVIVTAAVYWGFNSMLRLAVDISS